MIFINIYLATSGLSCNEDLSATAKTSDLPCIMWNLFVGKAVDKEIEMQMLGKQMC